MSKNKKETSIEYYAIAYYRLSKDDRGKNESDSIANQRKLIDMLHEKGIKAGISIKPDTCVENRKLNSFFNTVDFASTQILSAIGCHCGTKNSKHNHENFGDFSRRSVCHNNVLSKLIDGSLQSQ